MVSRLLRAGTERLGRDEAGRRVVLTLAVLSCMAMTCWAYFGLGIEVVFTHLSYVPIVAAAFWWGRRGLWVGALLGMWVLACGVLSPVDASYVSDVLRITMFMVVGGVVASLKELTVESEARGQAIFEHSPVALWTQDFSATKAYLDGLRQEGVTDWRAYFETHPEAVAQCAASASMLDTNEAALELYGARSEEQIRSSLQIATGEQSSDWLREQCIAMGEGRLRLEGEMVLETLTARKKEVVTTWEVMPGCEETLSRVIVSMMDVTGRKLVQDELKEGEQLLRQVLDTNPNLIFVKNGSGRYVLANRAMAELYGTTPDEIVGKTDVDFAVGDGISAQEAAQFLADDREVIDRQEAKVLPGAPLTQSDGTVRWFRTNKVPLTLGGRAEFVLGVGVDITERKRADEEVRKSEERYRALFDGASDAVLIRDTSGRFVEVNSVACQQLGYAREELIGMTTRDIVAPEYVDTVPQHATEVAQRGSALFETVHVRRDGTRIPVEVSARVIEYAGNPAVLWTARDITERRRAQAARRESEQLTRTIISSVNEGVVVYDRELRYRLWNDFMEDMTGVPAEMVLGELALETLPHLRAQGIRGLLERALSGKTVQAGEVPQRFAQTGESGWVVASYSPHRDPTGEIIGVVGTVRDVTERKRVEKEVEERRLYLESVLASAPDAIVTLDRQNRVTEWNRGAEKLFGYGSEQALGRDIDALVAGGDSGVSEQAAGFSRQTLAGEPVPSTEVVRCRQDGIAVNVIVAGSPIRRGDELIGTVATYTDISERRQMEEALQEQQQLLSTVLNINPNCIFVKDREGKYVLVNQAIVELYDTTAESMVGKTDPELAKEHGLDAKEAELFLTDDLDVIRSKQTKIIPEESFTRPDGTVRWLRTTKVPLTSGEMGDWLLGVAVDISDRKQAEDALRANEQLLSAVIETNPNGVFVKDSEGRYVLLNATVAEAYGSTPDGMLGKTDPEFAELQGLDMEEAERYLADDLEVIRSRQTKVIPAEPFTRTDGAVQWLQTTKVPLDLEGSGGGVLGVAVDITKRKDAEEALRQSEERYRQLVENAGDLVYMSDSRGRFTFVNPITVRMLGFSEEELIGKHYLDVIRPDHREDVGAFYQQQFEQRIPSTYHELPVVTKDGEEVWLGQNVQLIAKDDWVEGFQAVARDVTARRQAEEEAARSQELLLALGRASEAVVRARTPDEVYRTLGEQISGLGHHVIVLTLTEDQKYLAVAQTTMRSKVLEQAERLAGISIRDFKIRMRPGLAFTDVVETGETGFTDPVSELTARTLPRIVRPLAAKLTDSLGLRQGINAPLRIGEKTLGVLSVTGDGLTRGDVPAITAFANQAAIALENARLYEEARARSAELERSNEEIKQFAYIVSHDLRAPLVNLQGFSAELGSGVNTVRSAMESAMPHLDEKQRTELKHAVEEDIPEALGFIQSSVGRMDRFIGAVLELSRLGRRELNVETLDMEGMVQAAVGSLAHQIEQGDVKVTVGTLPEVVADRVSMEQIMGNLLTNAVIYLDPARRGEIEVTAERVREDTVFRVHDNGRGIAEEDMSKVFAPFRRVGRQDVSGEGMGLPYVQTLVRRHGGRIWCESQLGVGTSFFFAVPNNVTEGVGDGYD